MESYESLQNLVFNEERMDVILATLRKWDHIANLFKFRLRSLAWVLDQRHKWIKSMFVFPYNGVCQSRVDYKTGRLISVQFSIVYRIHIRSPTRIMCKQGMETP